MSTDSARPDRYCASVRVLAAAAAAGFANSAVLHVARPERMAHWARWDRSNHYQREIAVFDAVHALGLLRLAQRPDDANYLQLVSLTGLLLGLNHHFARHQGDTGPVLNPLAAWGNTVASAVGLILASRLGRSASNPRR